MIVVVNHIDLQQNPEGMVWLDFLIETVEDPQEYWIIKALG